MNKIKRKLIVFDTDGVIFRSQYLLQLSYHSGFFHYLRAFFLCFLFSINLLSMRKLLETIYGSLQGIGKEDFWKVYDNMKLVDNARETINSIKEKGHSVVLISSGVPDFLMKHLAERLEADCGYGIDTKFNNGTFTGDICGELSFYDGKTKVVEKLLQEKEFTWDDVIAVGDDRNNLDIMSHAKISIGYNSNYQVRKKTKYVTDSYDLKKVLTYIDTDEGPSFVELSKSLSKEFTYSWKQEFRRKGVHVCTAFIPFFADIHQASTLYILIGITLLFIFSEWLRLNGISLPVINPVTRYCIRTNEQRRFTLSPVTLSAGVICSLIFFPKATAHAVIMIVAFSDSIATLAGRFYGRNRIPYNQRKSLEGSLAFFLSATICTALYFPFSIALVTSFVSCIIESLPIKADNLTIPLGTGLFLTLLTNC
ncbi:MAG: HAD-IB family phosphatase [Candidatus Scalindua sp.]|nr:HAD-IB family phosphatase [Candidatus Scalindua sp.]